jgi:CRISPR-associated protein Cas6
MPHVDLAFRIVGRTIPVDHGYSLYSAISHIIPEIHASKETGVHPIRGIYSGDGALLLSASSRLILRVPDTQIRVYLKLAGKRLDVATNTLRVGVPEVRLLRPASKLHARLVTFKNSLEEGRFLEVTRERLDKLQVAGELELGQRRTLRVKDKQVVGFELAIGNLSAEESVSLQENGLGGRRHMGCGVLIPVKAS